MFLAANLFIEIVKEKYCTFTLQFLQDSLDLPPTSSVHSSFDCGSRQFIITLTCFRPVLIYSLRKVSPQKIGSIFCEIPIQYLRSSFHRLLISWFRLFKVQFFQIFGILFFWRSDFILRSLSWSGSVKQRKPPCATPLLNLQSRSLCQTLSNVFDISRKTPFLETVIEKLIKCCE